MKFTAILTLLAASSVFAAPTADLEKRQTANGLSGPCKKVMMIYARGSTELGNVVCIILYLRLPCSRWLSIGHSRSFFGIRPQARFQQWCLSPGCPLPGRLDVERSSEGNQRLCHQDHGGPDQAGLHQVSQHSDRRRWLQVRIKCLDA